MSHTPEQAKELWCPMVRAARREVIEHRTGYMDSYRDEQVLVPGCNTDALGDDRVPAFCCIANKCAMWRWSPKRGSREGGASTHTNNLKRAIHTQGSSTPTHGYCGLAGNPNQ